MTLHIRIAVLGWCPCPNVHPCSPTRMLKVFCLGPWQCYIATSLLEAARLQLREQTKKNFQARSGAVFDIGGELALEDYSYIDELQTQQIAENMCRLQQHGNDVIKDGLLTAAVGSLFQCTSPLEKITLMLLRGLPRQRPSDPASVGNGPRAASESGFPRGFLTITTVMIVPILRAAQSRPRTSRLSRHGIVAKAIKTSKRDSSVVAMATNFWATGRPGRLMPGKKSTSLVVLLEEVLVRKSLGRTHSPKSRIPNHQVTSLQPQVELHLKLRTRKIVAVGKNYQKHIEEMAQIGRLAYAWKVCNETKKYPETPYSDYHLFHSKPLPCPIHSES